MLLWRRFAEDPCSLLNAVKYIFQMFNFFKKINILFLLGFSSNAAFIYSPFLSSPLKEHIKGTKKKKHEHMMEKSL